jgi:hypothetical protein
MLLDLYIAIDSSCLPPLNESTVRLPTMLSLPSARSQP